MSTVTGHQYLARTLHGLGVDHVFFMDAIMRPVLFELKKLGVKRILAHSEKAAAYMADGYARASGRPGVCFSQSVGAANLASGLQDAYLHRAPVVAITGRRQNDFQHRNAYQEVDHASLFQAVTKFHAQVDSADQLPLLLAQAFREATEGTPRPTHLDVAGLQGEVMGSGEIASPQYLDAAPDQNHARYPASRPEPNVPELERAAAALNQAKKPVVVVGAGAVASGAHQILTRFSERHGLPIATSTGGHEIMPSTHANKIGPVGSYSAPPANQILFDADLVLFVGCHTGDQVTLDWKLPNPEAKIIQIDADASEIGRNYPNVVRVHSDPTLALQRLTDLIEKSSDREVWRGDVQQRVTEWRASVESARASTQQPIVVDRLCAEIGEALPENAILVADTGYSAIWSSTMIDMKHEGQSYLRAAGSLGWAFPAALGAQCAEPDRPVVCFCGDGAFYYHLPELETAKRWNIPLVTIVNNNSCFAQGINVIRGQHEGYDGNIDEVHCFEPTNFADVAAAFGVKSFRVEDPEDIRPTLDEALALNEPVLIDVATDRECRAPAPWSPTS